MAQDPVPAADAPQALASPVPAPMPPSPLLVSPVTAPLRPEATPLEARLDTAQTAIRWKDRWGLAKPLEYVSIVVFGAGALAMQSVPVTDRHWGGDGFDNAFRDALRIKDPGARRTVRSVSDGLWFGMMGFPFVVDALLVVGPRDSVTAWQLFVIDGEATTFSALLSQLAERTAGRTRPYVQECGKDPGYKVDCQGPKAERYQSFLSGHTQMTFNGAGLTCANHLHMPLYGGGAPDVVACVAALTLAATEGTLRVASDRHYMTDVLAGAALGFAAGYSIPILTHFGRKGASGPATTALLPFATDTQAGLQVLGGF